MDSQYTKRCLKRMGIVLISVLFTIGLFNIVMDPYDIFGLVSRKRPMELVDMSYLTKAVQLMSNKADTLIIGSSIVDHGFAVKGSMEAFYDKSFDEKRNHLEAKIKQDNIYNAGIRNGGLKDIYHYIQHAYKNNPELKYIILGLEFNLFTYARRADVTVPKVSPLMQTRISPQFYANNIIAWPVTCDSIKTFLYFIRNKLHTIYFLPFDREIDLGIYLKNFKNISKDSCANLKNRFFHRFDSEVIHYAPENTALIQGDSGQSMAALLFSVWSLSAVKDNLVRVGEQSILNPDAYNTLREIIDFTKEKNIRVDVYVSPQHGTYWQIAHQYGLTKYIDQWLKQLAEITSYWDFSDMIDFNKNVDQYFDTDALHFNSLAGEIILPAILRGSAKLPPGTRYVTRKNLHNEIAQRHLSQLKWYQHNHFLKTIINSSSFAKTENIRGDLNKTLVVIYHPDFAGYHLVKIMDKYMALPANKSSYQFDLLFRDKVAEAIRGESVEDLVAKINGLNRSANSVEKT